MTIPNTFVAGTTAAAAEVNDNFTELEGSRLKFAGSDTVASSIGTSTTETALQEIIINPNEHGQFITAMAGIRFTNVSTITSQQTGTFKMYAGSAANFASNAEIESTVLSFWGDATSRAIMGGVLIGTVTAADVTFSGSIYIQITGKNSLSNSQIISHSDYLHSFGA